MSTRLPQLAAELERAAERQAAKRRRTPLARWSRPGTLALAVGLSIATGATGAVLIGRGAVGGEPTSHYGADAPEAASGVHYGTRPVVLATSRLSDGRRLELVGYQQTNPHGGTDICIDVHITPPGSGFGCGNDRERAQGISGINDGLIQTRLATGATEPDVDRVVVSYVSDGQRGESDATLVRVAGPVLARVKVSDPFGFYVAELPMAAHNLTALAFDAGGRERWRAIFPSPGTAPSPRPGTPDAPGAP